MDQHSGGVERMRVVAIVNRKLGLGVYRYSESISCRTTPCGG
jgi:hypothetical protein